MFETLTNLNLIKLLTTTDQLSIKHSSGNDKLAADVEEAVKEMVEDYSELCEEYAELQIDNSVAVQHIIQLEKMLKAQDLTFTTYTDKMNKEWGFKI